jgi:hypothetical protein
VRFAIGAFVVLAAASVSAACQPAASPANSRLPWTGFAGAHDGIDDSRNGTWQGAQPWRILPRDAAIEQGASVCLDCHRCNMFDSHPANPFLLRQLSKLREALRRLGCNPQQRFISDHEAALSG